MASFPPPFTHPWLTRLLYDKGIIEHGELDWKCAHHVIPNVRHVSTFFHRMQVSLPYADTQGLFWNLPFVSLYRSWTGVRL